MELDFDDEARKLFEVLHLLPDAQRKMYNALGKSFTIISNGYSYECKDAVYKHQETGACLYIGNENSSKDRETLAYKGIAGIINCTETIPLYMENEIVCSRFHISNWMRELGRNPSTETLIAYFQTAFLEIDSALETGDSVLVHCLAGAHRAGTFGVCYVLYKNPELNFVQVLAILKTIRPIINPISLLKELALMYDKSLKA